MAASVSTFVVSWKEAAERNDSVAREAFVMSRMTGSNAGLAALLLLHAGVLALECHPVDHLAGQEVRVARLLDLHLLQHLPDDQLDVLVVNVDALRLVDLLHLADEVLLRRGGALAGHVVQLKKLDRAREPSLRASPGSTR